MESGAPFNAYFFLLKKYTIKHGKLAHCTPEAHSEGRGQTPQAQARPYASLQDAADGTYVYIMAEEKLARMVYIHLDPW